VENSPENIEKIRKALSCLPDGEAHKISDTDLDQYRVVRVSGEITVDLLEDGHISIPQEIVDKLKIDRGSKLRVTVEVEKGISKDTILSYAGLLSDLTGEQEKRFDESVKRRSFY
jgi:bifunctional DNA-binding transcriptional regulator/antitoxin component of YhaV-PrlF toxin-antitoxin module